jgi:hypothetical protein
MYEISVQSYLSTMLYDQITSAQMIRKGPSTIKSPKVKCESCLDAVGTGVTIET